MKQTVNETDKSPKPDMRIHVIVSGIVQGVFFRANTKSEADRLGVYGWVRNMMDGTVEIIAEGKEDNIDRFIQWCRKGPPGADVKNLELNREEFKGEFKSFNVAY
tara:strand:+ start:2092 stop:2406 length:315 start_codon:yes stop_codon:yes gene_type:complete